MRPRLDLESVRESRAVAAGARRPRCAEHLPRGLRTRTRRARRPPGGAASSVESRERGTVGTGRVPPGSACSRAARNAPPRRRTRRGARGRRRLAPSAAELANPARYSAPNSQSPDRSPVKTRPVRFPPCAAGASPRNSTRASGSPNPGTGRPQYSSSRNDARFSRATCSRHSTSRGQARHSTISAVTAASARRIGVPARRGRGHQAGSVRGLVVCRRARAADREPGGLVDDGETNRPRRGDPRCGAHSRDRRHERVAAMPSSWRAPPWPTASTSSSLRRATARSTRPPTGLIGSNVALAPIPGGSTNVFARAVGYGNDIERAAERLVSALDRGAIRRVGVGVGERSPLPVPSRRGLRRRGGGAHGTQPPTREAVRRPPRLRARHRADADRAASTATTQSCGCASPTGSNTSRTSRVVSNVAPYTYVGPSSDAAHRRRVARPGARARRR